MHNLSIFLNLFILNFRQICAEFSLVNQITQCPVCQTEYMEGQVNFCFTCGWDLTPYPLTFAGQVPEAFLEKEQAKIAWAREMWAKSHSQLSAGQLKLERLNEERSQLQEQLSKSQLQLKDANQETSKIQSQLDQIKQEKAQFQSQLSQVQSQLEKCEQERTLREATLAHLQSQIKQADAERSHLEGQLAQVLPRLQQLSQERASDVIAALSHLEARLERMEAQLQLARHSLSHWIPNLTLQLTQELVHIPDKSKAREQIDDLLQSWQEQHGMSQPYRNAVLEAIKSALEIQNQEQVENLKEYLAAIGENNPITQVDALLNARSELKLRGIIKRDIDGDTLYDS